MDTFEVVVEDFGGALGMTEHRFTVWVVFVEPDRFDRFEAELEELSDAPELSSVVGGKPISELRDFAVVRFIVDEVVLADWFPDHRRRRITTRGPNDRGAW